MLREADKPSLALVEIVAEPSGLTVRGDELKSLLKLLKLGVAELVGSEGREADTDELCVSLPPLLGVAVPSRLRLRGKEEDELPLGLSEEVTDFTGLRMREELVTLFVSL